MKQFLSLMLVLLACCLCTCALAETESEFNRGCWVKTGTSTTLYKLKTEDSGITVGESASIDEDFTPAGSLPGGTYVRILSTLSAYGLDKVSYWSGGGTASGYILSSSLISATTIVHLDDGNSVEVPEAMKGDTSAIVRYLNNSYSDAKFSAIEGSSTIHVEYAEGATIAWKPVTTEHLSFHYTLENREEDEEGPEIIVNYLGSAYSSIVLNGSTLNVPTFGIAWKSNEAVSHQLAYINAPRSGKATMHLKSSARSTPVMKCSQGQIVAVLSAGKNYTKIWCEDKVGYVLTSTLNFLSHEQAGADARLAYITFRGKTRSKNEINIRAEARSTSRMIGTFRAGTPCVLFGDDGTWSEIELQGLHGFVLSEFITTAFDLGG